MGGGLEVGGGRWREGLEVGGGAGGGAEGLEGGGGVLKVLSEPNCSSHKTICARIVGAIGQFASVRGAGCLIFSFL